jgi:hypothetical protein
MNTIQTFPNWQFWLMWFLAFLAFPIGGVLAKALAGAINTPIAALFGGLLTGLVLGLAQWLVLRQQFSISFIWVLATGFGMAIGLFLSQVFLGSQTAGSDLLWRGLITGLAIGLAQALVLYNLEFPLLYNLIWVITIGLSWSLGWFITRAVGVDLTPQWTVFGSTGAWAFQIITGLLMYWQIFGTQGAK